MRGLILFIILTSSTVFAQNSREDCDSLLALVQAHPIALRDGELFRPSIPIVSSHFPARSYFQEQNYYTNLQPEIRTLMLQAMNATAAVKNNWTTIAAQTLNLMRATEAEIAEHIAVYVDDVLSHGRKQGFGRGVEVKLLEDAGLSGSNTRLNSGPEILGDAVTLSELTEKYGLRELNGMLSKFDLTLENRDANRGADGSHFYTLDLRYMLDAAYEAGLDELAQEAFLYLIRLGDFDDAANAIMQTGNNTAILALGKLALTKYLYHDAFNNGLWYAIHTLAKVQGPERAEASQLLADLSSYLRSSEYLRHYGNRQGADAAERSLENAISTLQLSGEEQFRAMDDSVKINHVTRLQDSKSKLRMIELLKESFQKEVHVGPAKFTLAAYALGDLDQLRGLAKSELSKLNVSDEWSEYKWKQIYRLALLVGDPEFIETVVRWPVDRGLQVSFFLVKIENLLLSEELLQRVIDIIARHQPSIMDDDFYSPNDYLKNRDLYQESIIDEEARRLRRLAKSPDQTHIENALMKGLDMSLSERRKLSELGYRLIYAGDLWEAYQAFLKAADQEGLLYVGQVMLSTGNGFHASRPLLAASMLSPRQRLVEASD